MRGNRYLFNVGEGLQRFTMEHKQRISKIGSIFLTRLSPMTVGGLTGVLLTLADTGRSKLQVHGPRGTAALLVATRSFFMRYVASVVLCTCALLDAGVLTQEMGMQA